VKGVILTMVAILVFAGGMIALAWSTVTKPSDISTNSSDAQATIMHFCDVLELKGRDTLTIVQLKDTLPKLDKSPIAVAQNLKWHGSHLDSLLLKYAEGLATIMGDNIINDLRALQLGAIDTSEFCRRSKAATERITHLRIEVDLAKLAQELPADAEFYPRLAVSTVWNRFDSFPGPR
jgi:hypothetical protein